MNFPAIEFFIAISLVIGVTSVVAQILVSFAATLAKDHERGKVVGQVMSGLLIGILLARTLAGIISELAGWRAVFGAAALMLLVLTMIFSRALPRYKHGLDITYPQLLASVVHMFKTERVLLIRSAYGALGFANFSVLSTPILISDLHLYTSLPTMFPNQAAKRATTIEPTIFVAAAK